jgi:type VII secretion integral membrane protein EccD
VLALAPRISIAVAGAGSAVPSTDEPVIDVVAECAAVLAHRTLTGMVIGSSACAAIGSAAAAFGHLQDGGSSLSAAALPTVTALVLTLRSRTYADDSRQLALVASGMVSATASFVVIVVAVPACAYWLSLLAVAAGVAALTPMFVMTVSPVTRRTAEVVDYLALAAVVPAACWVGGVFSLVREANLL